MSSLSDAPATPCAEPHSTASRLALLGIPNVGKTSLFNRLTNLLAKTSNYPGTTVELRTGSVRVDGQSIEMVNLPGLYTLDADSPGENITRALLAGELEDASPPIGLVIVVDASHLERTLFIVQQVQQLGLPMLVAVNMIDVARKQGIRVDCQRLSEQLHCQAIPVSARTGEGLDELKTAMLSLAAESG